MVKDRLSELNERRNNIKAEKRKTSYGEKKKGISKGHTMTEVFEEVTRLDGKISKLKEDISKMKSLQKDLYQSVTYDRKKIGDLSRISDQIYSSSIDIKREIDRLRSEWKEVVETNAPSTHDRMTSAQLGRLSSELSRAMNEFQDVQAQHVDKTQERYKRQMEIMNLDTSHVSNGHVIADLADVQTMFACNPLSEIRQAQEDLRETEERERQIRQIETSVREVNELFKQVNALVLEQGDTIDTIENNVEKAQAEVISGKEQLGKAKKHRKKWFKRKLCLIGIGVVVVLIVAGVVALVILTG